MCTSSCGPSIFAHQKQTLHLFALNEFRPKTSNSRVEITVGSFSKDIKKAIKVPQKQRIISLKLFRLWVKRRCRNCHTVCEKSALRTRTNCFDPVQAIKVWPSKLFQSIDLLAVN